jgi:AraC family transcriptional regulator, transcriptional activator of the genes for pyochelin and ferripyochelin receptors
MKKPTSSPSANPTEMSAPKRPLIPEVAQEVPFPGGNLQYKHYAIQNMAFCEFHGQLKEAGPLPDIDETESIVMLFVSKGRLRIALLDAEAESICSDQTHNAFYCARGSCTIEADAGELQGLKIVIDLSHFQSLAIRCAAAWQNLAGHAGRGQSSPLLARAAYLDMPIHVCLQQIMLCPLPTAYQTLYLEAKVMELMALQAACGALAQLEKPRHSKTEYDRERMLFAKEYLLKHIAMPPTLARLALVSGLNEFKLKNGFREMFGNSVFAYLAEHRLQLAKTALAEGQKTATEIAFELGYSSLQHFSSKFKARYGVTPTALRRK